MSVLQTMTGQTFVMDAGGSRDGIVLQLSTSAQLSPDDKAWLKDKGREPFIIRSQDDKKLTVTANGELGLQHGLYYYLDQLGARFYFPNENWTIIPRRDSIILPIDRRIAPDFKVRTFFGTGGFGGRLAVDPDMSLQKRWDLWKRRNRFGAEYYLGGHSGEAFNQAHKQFLIEHPDYLAKVDGKYVSWAPSAKLNTANPNAVKLFVDWTVERFRQMRQKDPHAFAVSVDPSDGGGHCNSDECKKIGNGSASDQIFYIANQAAKAIRQEFPDGWVNLYGYNEHAMPPSFDLEPNVYVSIIPYAFQRTGLSPEEFIKAWGAKVKRMSIYDYWSIPDWTSDMPSFNYLKTPAQKLKLWHANNIEGFSSESTYSAGAMGAGWLLASRLMWDLDADQNAILNDFYDNAFGAARPPMQRMLERWATSFKLTGYELAWSYRDLQEAQNLAKTPEVKARIADYVRYVEYLRHYIEWQNAPKEKQPEALRNLVNYIWSIYPSVMIHAFREYQLLTRSAPTMREDYAKADSAGWKNVSAPTPESLAEAVAAGVKEFQPLPFEPRQYSDTLVPLTSTADINLPEKAPSLFLVGTAVLQFEARPGQTALPLRINGTAQVQLQDMAEKVLFEKDITPNAGQNTDPAGLWKAIQDPANLQQFSIPVPQSGHYRLLIKAAKNDKTHLQLPLHYLLTLQHFRTGKPLRSPRLYFYVPKGLKTLALYQPHILPEIMEIRFYNPQGERITPTIHDNRRVYLLEIPSGQDGKIWSLDNLVTPNYSMEMLNAPQAFSLYPDTLLIPQDALSR